MYFFIQSALVGFALGYLAALVQGQAQDRKRRRRNKLPYIKGKNDCRNCKYMRSVGPTKIVDCKQHPGASLYMPIACGYYNPIHEEDSEEE